MSVLDAIAKSDIEKKKEEQKLNLHSEFKKRFLEAVHSNPSRFEKDVYIVDTTGGEKKYILPVDYDNDIICSPEPIEYIDAFNDSFGNVSQCQTIMNELIDGSRKYKNVSFVRINSNSKPKDGMWFNSTKNGINIRPGYLEDGEDGRYAPVKLGDESVHGVVVGRTGSGKSVFLNNIILNMLTEYSPWELDLYLADFKKVELSRYMSAGEKYHTPHLRTCAATSEIRYVISMLNHLVDCMQARQDLFTRLGIQKISDFRTRYKVVLPRIVLLIDEFQQMFQEATTAESTIINDLLMSIIKLGRATGFHLIFASQEMKGALSGKALANFKIRFALPCDSSVSSEILGNSEAARLDRGYVLVNYASGKAEDNKKYKVPYIKDDEEKITESYFYKTLAELVEQESMYSFKKKKTFYQEDEQKDISQLEEVLEKVKEFKKDELSNNPDYFDILTLGHGVVYSERKYDLETCYLERGRNRNILAVCTEIDDLAYVQKMLAINFAHASYSDRLKNYYFDLHPILAAKYNITEDIDIREKYDNESDFEKIRIEYYLRLSVKDACSKDNISGFFSTVAEKLKEYTGYEYKSLAKAGVDLFGEVDITELLNKCNEIDNNSDEDGNIITKIARYYYYGHYYYPHIAQTELIPWRDIFEPVNYWISGVEYVENSLPKWFFNVMRNAMDMNILLLVFSASEDIKFADLVARSEYLFVSGKNEKIYNRCGIKFTKKGRNSIVIDFKIKSLNTERSFKKYKIKTNLYEVPEINFDEILL